MEKEVLFILGAVGTKSSSLTKWILQSFPENYVLSSSSEFMDCSLLRKYSLHNHDNILELLRLHKRFNFNVNRSFSFDSWMFSKIQSYKKELFEKHAKNSSTIIIKEPRIRYLLPYFLGVFKNSKIIFCNTNSFTDYDMFERKKDIFNLFYNTNLNSIHAKNSLIFIKDILLDNLHVCHKLATSYICLNSDDLDNSENFILLTNFLNKNSNKSKIKSLTHFNALNPF